MDEVSLNHGEILLKTLTREDAAVLYKLIDKNRSQIGEWLLWVDQTKSIADVEKLIHTYIERREKGTGMNFGIWYQETLIGYISFASIDQVHKKADIAYWLDTEYQGKGIVTAACKQLIAYGFEELNLNRIEISCAEGNSKSSAVPERLGFTEEGISRKTEEIRGGKLVDNHHFALLKKDWKK